LSCWLGGDDMYSPKVKEEFIPYLYKEAKRKHKPMTQIVNSIIKKHVEREAKNMKKK